jgi:hypothetical protein
MSQALDSDIMVSATRSSTSSLKFELQSQRMKKKIQNSSSCKPILGLWYQYTTWGLKFNHKEWIFLSNFTSYEPSLGLRYQQTAWGLKFNHKERKKISNFQYMWANPEALISTNSLRFEVQLQRMKKVNSKFQFIWATLKLWFQHTAWGL